MILLADVAGYNEPASAVVLATLGRYDYPALRRARYSVLTQGEKASITRSG